ncbi:MAG: hypothetical protein V2A73_03750 [Pseudomonadota bacterium]
MENDRFKIIFEKLAATGAEWDSTLEITDATQQLADELDEIRELRRLALDISEPEAKLFTTT